VTQRDETLRKLCDLAALVGGRVVGDADLLVRGVSGLAEATEGDLAFYNNPRYREQLKATKAAAVVVSEKGLAQLDGRPAIVAADPYLAFAKISSAFHPAPRFAPGIDPRACVEAGAEVDPTATVMAFAFVAKGARIGERTVLFPGAYVGEEARVGRDVVIYPNVVVRERCSVGDRSILQPGVVVGGDGFGFAFDPSVPCHFKIPQAGVVEIESDVEIGANTAIDRATLGATRIGQGPKIDNLTQIGHHVKVGPLCILCGQVGLAGSSELGAGVVCGGQVGVANHVKVCDKARILAQSGLLADVPGAGGGCRPPSSAAGTP